MKQGLIIALIISIALNVFGGGFISGRLLATPESSPAERFAGGGNDNPMRILRYTDELSPDMRDKFRNALRSNLQINGGDRDEIRALRRAYNTALAAEPWDRATIEAARSNLDTALEQRRVLINKGLLGALELLEPEARAALLKRAEEGRERRWRHRERRRGGDNRQ